MSWYGKICILVVMLAWSAVSVRGQNTRRDDTGLTLAKLADQLSFQETFRPYRDANKSAVLKKLISLHLKNATLFHALQEIADKTGLKLSYSSEFVPLAKKLNLDLEHVTVNDALWKVLEGTNLRYAVSPSGHLVLLKYENKELVNRLASKIVQQDSVHGKVTDVETGEALPGVNVLIKGTSLGTATDVNGNYTLTVPSLTDTLVISYIGYQTQTIPIRGRSMIDVALKMQAVSGGQVVVIGYGTKLKRQVTGSISSVQASDLQEQPVTRVEDALQGRTSGVTIAASSGQPGAASNVRIRGVTSINNSDPLYIVDGVPVDNGGIGYLNPEDIASIQVLKDAASAAIYGTRAANGVILITTKKGTAGNMQVNYNGYVGIQQPAKKLDLLDATEYATLRNEASVAAGNGILFPNPKSLGKGTDWQSTIFNNSAAIMNHDLSISGGNSKATYYASLGYFDQQGIVASPISHDKRITIRINTTLNLKSWLRFGENFGYTYDKNRGLGNTNSEFGGPLSSAINLDPITPAVVTKKSVANSSPYSTQPVIRNDKGQPYGISTIVGQEMTNPLAYIQTKLGNYNWSDNIVGNVYAEIEPIRGIKFRSSLGAKKAFWGADNFTPVFFLSPTQQNLTNASIYRDMHQGLIWNWDNTLTLSRNFGAHHVTFLVGTSAQTNNARSVNGSFLGIPADNFDDASMNFSVPTVDRIAGGSENQPYALNSYFGRISYNYKGKYLLTGILRVDGSSRFGSANRYGRFPAVSVGWVPTLESFWPENNVVTFLKIRGSYGVNGNDKSLSDFQYVSTISGGRNYVLGPGGTIYTGASPNAPANPDLKWERTSQLDLGFDATLFTDFTLTFDVYNKKTSGMLRQIAIPIYVGASGQPYGNVASLTDKGLEVDLGYQKQIGSFNINVNANASYAENEVTDIGDQQFISGATFQAAAFPISRTAVGEPVGEFYGFKELGIFQTQAEVDAYKNKAGGLIQPNASPGDFKWADLNGDGQITSDDRTFLGNPTPPWTFGITASADWKNFDILVFGQGVYGNDIFQGLRRLDILTANYTTAALGRWTGPGTSNTFPRLDDSDPNKNFTRPSDFYLSSGSYFRIKTLELGYSLPSNITRAIGLQKMRFYVSGHNLFTFTNYTGYDPEIGGNLTGSNISYGIDRGIYPQARSFMFGWDVTL